MIRKGERKGGWKREGGVRKEIQYFGTKVLTVDRVRTLVSTDVGHVQGENRKVRQLPVMIYYMIGHPTCDLCAS